MSVRQDDGCTLREHYFSVWEQTDIKPLELCYEKPDLGGHVWDYFIELHNRRSDYGWGHQRLTFVELEAWKTTYQRKLDAWELKAILAIDDAYIASIAKKPKPEGS